MGKSVLFFSRFPADANGGGARREAQLTDLLLPLDYRFISCWDSNCMKKKNTGTACIISWLQKKFSPYKKYWVDEDTWEYVFNLRTVTREWQRLIRENRDIKLVVLDDPIYFYPVVEYVYKKRIPLVGLCQNLESLSLSQLNKKHQLKLFHHEIRLLKKCALVVTISREETFLLQNLNIPALYLPYDPTKSIRERLLKVRERRTHSTKEGFLALGTAGNKATLEGMTALIDYWGSAQNRLKNEKLLVGGYWTRKYLKVTPAENIVILGEIADTKLDDLLSTVKAMICFQEFGSGALTKIREMLLAGVPVLANAHAARSYHEYNGAGVVEFTNIEDLDKAAAMIETMGNPGAPGETNSLTPPLSISGAISTANRELLGKMNVLRDGRSKSPNPGPFNNVNVMNSPSETKNTTPAEVFDWENFNRFSYSKHSHIILFDRNNYEVELFRGKSYPSSWSLKRYQDLLVFSFIKQMLPPGSKLLEVGGGISRIIACFKDQYECWNVDKLAGCGQGPTWVDASGFRLVQDYMGNFNPALPDNYFDFVFSISALEHVPDGGPQLLGNILTDLNRVLKPGCYSLHCFDSILMPSNLWTNKLLPYIFQHEKTFNWFIPYKELSRDGDIFVLSEEIYNKEWRSITGKEYHEYGKPFSYNVLWKKGR
jgi:ubiquinone/menaquinone biosynthesis C-methylase UbiE